MIDLDSYECVITGVPSLQECRRAIDEIDRIINDLMSKRMRVVDQVIPLKAKQNVNRSFFRVHRELEVIINSMHALRNSHYPKECIIQMWRLFISASLTHECKFSILASNQHCFWLAREYCGSFVENVVVENSGDLIATLLADKPGKVGCLPFPGFQVADKWWLHLLRQELKVFAICPLSKEDSVAPVLFVAAVDLEPTNADSFLVVLLSDLSDIDVVSRLAARDIVVSVIDSADVYRLLLVKGFPEISQLALMKDLLDSEVEVIGAFTNRL